MSGDTGDAADLIAAVGPQGNFSNGYTHLAQLASEMQSIKESHHFYPVLVYFRFNEPYYTLSRLTTVMLDAVTLIKSGLDDEQFASLKQSAAVDGIWRTTMRLLTSVDDVLLHRRPAQRTGHSRPMRLRWTAGDAGITPGSSGCARQGYARLLTNKRASRFTCRFGPDGTAWPLGSPSSWPSDAQGADPAGTDPQSAIERPDFAFARLHSAG